MFTNEVQWSSLHVEEQPFVEYGNSVELGANPSCISLLLVVGDLETCLGPIHSGSTRKSRKRSAAFANSLPAHYRIAVDAAK
jgi:hypothetical protein